MQTVDRPNKFHLEESFDHRRGVVYRVELSDLKTIAERSPLRDARGAYIRGEYAKARLRFFITYSDRIPCSLYVRLIYYRRAALCRRHIFSRYHRRRSLRYARARVRIASFKLHANALEVVTISRRGNATLSHPTSSQQVQIKKLLQ